MTDLSPAAPWSKSMTDLSPQAQAVAWAYNNTPTKPTGSYYWLAAALRALDEQLGYNVLGVRAVDSSQIRLIADELEDFSD